MKKARAAVKNKFCFTGLLRATNIIMEKNPFVAVLRAALARTALPARITERMVTEGLPVYTLAFTHASGTPHVTTNSYELLELLGDATAHKVIVWYMANRFPAQAVSVIERLRVLFCNPGRFGGFAQRLGFGAHIRTGGVCRVDGRIADDVFGAFLGATEVLANEYYAKYGVGGLAVYHLLGSLFDEVPISTAYPDLYSPTARLKQLTESTIPTGTFAHPVGVVRRTVVCTAEVTHVTLTLHQSSSERLIDIGKGSAATKAGAMRLAAEQALLLFESWGYKA
jgi:dsRNA-specific ribonuclease